MKAAARFLLVAIPAFVFVPNFADARSSQAGPIRIERSPAAEETNEQVPKHVSLATSWAREPYANRNPADLDQGPSLQHPASIGNKVQFKGESSDTTAPALRKLNDY